MTMKLGTRTSIFVMILLTVLILVVQLSTRVTAIPNTNVVYQACGDTGTPLGPYAEAVRQLRNELKFKTHLNGYDYRPTYIHDGVACYGRAWCRRSLSTMDCNECVRIADIRIVYVCPNPVRALMGLVDCGMRIDDQPIIDE